MDSEALSCTEWAGGLMASRRMPPKWNMVNSLLETALWFSASAPVLFVVAAVVLAPELIALIFALYLWRSVSETAY